MKKRTIILLVVAILGIGIVAAICWRGQTKPIPLKLEFWWLEDGTYNFEITRDGEVITHKNNQQQKRTLSSSELRRLNSAIYRAERAEKEFDETIITICSAQWYTLRIPTKNLEVVGVEYGLSKGGGADDLVEMIFELSPIPVETKSGAKPHRNRTDVDQLFDTGWSK